MVTFQSEEEKKSYFKSPPTRTNCLFWRHCFRGLTSMLTEIKSVSLFLGTHRNIVVRHLWTSILRSCIIQCEIVQRNDVHTTATLNSYFECFSDLNKWHFSICDFVHSTIHCWMLNLSTISWNAEWNAT